MEYAVQTGESERLELNLYLHSICCVENLHFVDFPTIANEQIFNIFYYPKNSWNICVQMGTFLIEFALNLSGYYSKIIVSYGFSDA